jgi:Tfp pilus assembly protein PilO
MSFLRNNPIIVAVIAAVAATAAFWFLALSPKRQHAAELQTQISGQEQKLTVARQQLATYEKARTIYKASYATLAKLGKVVPADDDIRSLLVQLDAAGHATNVDFQKLSVGGGSSTTPSTTAPATTAKGLAPAPGTVPVGTTGISAMPFSLTFTGTYSNLTSFFSRLDHFVAVHNQHVSAHGRLLRVETINIAPGSTWPVVTADVSAASYLVAPTAQATPGASTSPTTATPASTPAPAATTSTTTATITGAAR